jgi:pyridoxamine 5'-phosphate oxidase
MMDNWQDDLAGFWDKAWDVLAFGAANAQSTARLCALATVGADGGAEARTVAVRNVDPGARILGITTDRRTPKTGELTANPRASLLFWVPEHHLQIRARVTIELRHAPEARAFLDRIPETARSVFRVEPVPGTPIADADDYIHGSEDHFAQITASVREMDLVWLGAPRHRRAVYGVNGDWAGQWISP